MSWIKDTDENVHNLDHVKSIEIEKLEEVEGEEDTPSHGVFITFPDNEQTAVFTGTEVECQGRLLMISNKLPVVKP